MFVVTPGSLKELKKSIGKENFPYKKCEGMVVYCDKIRRAIYLRPNTGLSVLSNDRNYPD